MANFPKLKNDALLKAARGEKTEVVPVWVMRQAGRYLPEFREVRKKHDFFDICQTPELACEVTLQPVDRFDLDAAIIFSDILVVPQAMGMTVKMLPGEGPSFPDPLKEPADMIKLKQNVNVYTDLKYVLDAITLTRHRLNGRVPLIGFSGAPWTLMGYMIEGGGSKTMSKAKKWLYKYPRQSHDLLSSLSEIITEYLIGQVKAGAQFLQLFDTNVGFLDPKMFNEFILPYVVRIRQQVKNALLEQGLQDVPMAFFPKDAHYSLDQLRDSGYDVISLDWNIPPKTAREALGSNVTLQGNLDPCALYSTPDTLKKIATEMLVEFGTSRYIANLGHGIYPDMDPSLVKVFIDTIHRESVRMNTAGDNVP